MKTENILKAINALPRGAALCEHFAYVFHADDDPEQPAQLLVDIIAWRTNSQRAEDEQFRDQSDLLHAIESLPGVAGVEQTGDIDHENGRGWTFKVTPAPLCSHCSGSASATALMTGCTCGMSDAECSEMWSAVVD